MEHQQEREADVLIDRIHHKIASGMVDRERLGLIITRDEAEAVLRGVYQAANRKYLDALQKGMDRDRNYRKISPVEAELRNRDHLDFLATLRQAITEGDYASVLEIDGVESVFGVPLFIEEVPNG